MVAASHLKKIRSKVTWLSKRYVAVVKRAAAVGVGLHVGRTARVTIGLIMFTERFQKFPAKKICRWRVYIYADFYPASHMFRPRA